MKSVSLTGLADLFDRLPELIKAGLAIVNAPTLRAQVEAVYDGCELVASLTPTLVDDAVFGFIEKAGDRYDVAIDAIVEGLELLGVDGTDGPYGAMDDEALAAKLQPSATTYGMNVFAIIAAVRAVHKIIKIAPDLIDGIKRVFPNLFGTVTEERLPPVPRPEPVAERTEA